MPDLQLGETYNLTFKDGSTRQAAFIGGQQFVVYPAPDPADLASCVRVPGAGIRYPTQYILDGMAAAGIKEAPLWYRAIAGFVAAYLAVGIIRAVQLGWPIMQSDVLTYPTRALGEFAPLLAGGLTGYAIWKGALSLWRSFQTSS